MAIRGDGILVETSNVMPFDNHFAAMTVTNNGGNGIAILGGCGHEITESTITGNNTSRNSHGGVAVVDACVSLSRNTIENNHCHGVYAGDALAFEPLMPPTTIGAMPVDLPVKDRAAGKW